MIYVRCTYQLILLISFVFINATSAQNEWELKKEVDNIKVFTRPVAGSKIDEYKVTGKLIGNLNAVVSIMQDMEAYKYIFDDTKKATIIKSEGDHTFWIYVHTNAPWPIKDRFGIYKNQFSFDKENQILRMEVNCVSELFNQEKKGIQIKNCMGSWTFQLNAIHEISVIHQFHADPEGMIPSSIVNKKTIDSPIYTLTRLSEIMDSEKYQGKNFSFIP